MTARERILAVYRGETPDVVPYMLDLSHWFYHKHGMPWDLSASYDRPEIELIDYHKQAGVGFYLPNLASFYSVGHGRDVQATVTKAPDGQSITWEYATEIGTVRRTRVWEERTYAWGIPEWGIKTEQDLRVLGRALAARTYTPHWDRYEAWVKHVGDGGVVYITTGYSGLGHMLNYWLGIEGTVYAMADWSDTLHGVVNQINANNLQLIDLIAQSPAEIVCMGDNFSSDIQPPRLFDKWSKAYYREAIRRLHDAGKHVAVHIDGKLRGALAMFRDIGADCADAVTPAPLGDLTPEECRAEAGPDFVLSGGVSPDLWLPGTDIALFKEAVLHWLGLKVRGPRFIANVGDQVPPGADENRIAIMREIVEEHGRY